jgi:hypothetical protein
MRATLLLVLFGMLSAGLNFPRLRGQVDYAAIAAILDLSSNSIGLS